MNIPSPTALKLFTFCFYIGKNTYHELVRMLYLLISSLDRCHPDFFLVVYHNLGITIDDPRVRMAGWGVPPPATDCVNGWGVKGERADLLLDADGCDGNVWVEGSAVRNRWYKLNFNRVHAFKNLYDEYDGVCFTWIDLDTIVVADLSYLGGVDNYFIFHGGGGGSGLRSDRRHDVLLGAGGGDGGGGGGDGGGGDGGGGVLWSVPERMYIHGSFWKLNLSLYHEILRLDALFRENGARLKYDVQSIFSVMAWGGGGGGGEGCDDNRCPFYGGVSRADSGSMRVIGYNYRPDVMNGLGVWDTKNGVGNHVNMEALANMRWGVSASLRRYQTNNDGESGDVEEEEGGDVFYTTMYPDKDIHILSLTFDSFFMSNVDGSADFARLFGGGAPHNGGGAPHNGAILFGERRTMRAKRRSSAR